MEQVKTRKFGAGTLSPVLALAGILWGTTIRSVCIGDGVLGALGLMAWSNGDMGTHFTVFYSLLFFIPGIILGSKYKTHFGAKSGRVISVIMTALLLIASLFTMAV